MIKKEEYIEMLEENLIDWVAKIEKFEAKAEQAEGNEKVKYQKEIEKLKKKREVAEKNIDELKQASEETWEELKESADNLWEEMTDILNKVVSKFK